MYHNFLLELFRRDVLVVGEFDSKFRRNTRGPTYNISLFLCRAAALRTCVGLGALLSSPIIYSADRKIKKMYSAVRWSKAECLSAQVFRTRRHFAFKLKLINAADPESFPYSIQLTSLSSSPLSVWIGSDRAAVWKLQMRQLHMYAMRWRWVFLSPVGILHSTHCKKNNTNIF